jgi:hypothetical protein
LSAIQEDESLQRSVLAGLAPSIRHIYANGGFVEPHVGRVILGEFDVLQLQRVSLASAVSVDVFSALYRACAQALIEQAKGDSVSNSEASLGSTQGLRVGIVQPVTTIVGRPIGYYRPFGPTHQKH